MKRLLIPALLCLALLTACTEQQTPAASPSSPPAEPSNAASEPTPQPEPEPEPEPLTLELSVPGTATVSAEEPELPLLCSVTRTGEGPENGRLQVFQNGKQVLDAVLPLDTGEFEVSLVYPFSRYMEQTRDTVEYRLSCEDVVCTAQTEVELINLPDEVYAQQSGEALPYRIEVVKNHNAVLVYGMDSNREYTKLVKTFLCSTGNWTPLGNFRATNRYLGFRSLYANAEHTAYCYGQYAIEFSGDYLFHSVPYFTPNKDDLEYEEFNKLGTTASLGCVRLAVADVKWLFDNCPSGTPVSVVEREELGAEKPEGFHIDPSDPNRSWDPTDPDPANPWHPVLGT